MDADGKVVWSRIYGGPKMDTGQCVKRTNDGGFVIVGHTETSDQRGLDLLVIKTNEIGTEMWSRTYGGPMYDYGYWIEQTPDGGYIIAGETNSYGEGHTDVFLLQTDSGGEVLWMKTCGGAGADGAREIRQTADGGYIVAGRTYSFGAGGYDAYIIRLEPTPDDLVSPDLALAVF